MFSCPKWVRAGLAFALLLTAGQVSAQAVRYDGIGRPATDRELAAWDIDVRPDFKGLPKGSGTVAKGQDIWEAKCASCHGIFGESNEVFSPLIGGTTAEDIKTGRVARLTDPSFPGRTTLMKLSSLSTLWDYINRAMPWNAPKSLSPDEVYAVTAFILNLGGIVPDDFTLSDANIRSVQERLPNRRGMTTDHAMWPGKAFGQRKPDTTAIACMSGCATESKVASLLPDFARNQHGNLAEQNRLVGAQRGADTTKPPAASLSESSARAVAPVAVATAPSTGSSAGGFALAQKQGCTACHGIDTKLVGPSFVDIAKKQGVRGDALVYLTDKIRAGGTGVWGAIPMPAQTLAESDAQALARWLIDGAKK